MHLFAKMHSNLFKLIDQYENNFQLSVVHFTTLQKIQYICKSNLIKCVGSAAFLDF